MSERHKTKPADHTHDLRSGPLSQTITTRPPFDPEAFARDTESRIRRAPNEAHGRLASTVPPPPGLPDYPSDLGSAPAADTPSLAPESVPALAVDRAELDWFELPTQVHLLLLHVNGSDSVAAISQSAGLELSDALTVLGDLARDGLVIASPDSPK